MIGSWFYSDQEIQRTLYLQAALRYGVFDAVLTLHACSVEER